MKLTNKPQIMALSRAIFSTLLILLFSSAINTGKANGNPVTPPQQDKVYNNVDHPPMYKGGMNEFYKFLVKTVKYPAEAREKKIQGRVGVSFVVEKDGSLTDIKAKSKFGHGLEEEAVRAIRSSPKWKPGTQKGKPVRVMYTVPVNFTLG